MAQDSTIWINDSWGGHKKIVKTPRGKRLPRWLRIILGISAVLGMALLLFFVTYLSKLVRN